MTTFWQYQTSGFSQFFRELDKEDRKEIFDKFVQNKEYTKRSNAWKLPLQKKALKREEKQ